MAMRWYVIHVHSMFENKVAEYIEKQAIIQGISDKFKEILVPSQQVTRIKNGKKISQRKRLYPGYVLIHMEMDDETWHLVCSNPKVTGFLGTDAKPNPISEQDVLRLVQEIEEDAYNAHSKVNFDISEQVRIIDGPFMGFNAVVDEVDVEKERLRVNVNIFDRNTIVGLEFKQVEKL